MPNSITKNSKLIWQLFLPILIIAISALLATAYYWSKSFGQLYYQKLADSLEYQCRLVEPQITAKMENADKICKSLGKKGDMRISVILPDGKVIGDSDENPEMMKDHSNRPEFIKAINKNIGKSVRFSSTLGKNMMYLAVPIYENDKVSAVIRTSMPITIVKNELHGLHKKMLAAGGIIALCAAAAAWAVSKKITRPIEQITQTAEQISAGNLTARAAVPKTKELAELAKTLNDMAMQIAGRIESITKDKDQTQAVLASMNRVENIRRDFVANVSHELKTPITSIKGFVETLLEDGEKNPEQTNNFLKIISRHADRLDAIIDDLLALCRLEEDGRQRNLSFEMQSVKPAIISAAELAKIKADAKNISIEINCGNSINAKINAALLEQAVLNLIDNAVKYSPDKSKITINVKKNGSNIEIAVEDAGCGIDAEHINRLFERFYVVDKARSRKLGGTGLGLAIVKHIAQVHNGNVSVQSNAGKGSIFTIQLPI